VKIKDDIPLETKKFVFKLVSDLQNSTSSSKTPIADIWKKYFSMGSQE
jgi:hypothetical protein